LEFAIWDLEFKLRPEGANLMWELIRANKKKSIILFIFMAACLIFLGYLVGRVFYPKGGGLIGIFIALVIWGILGIISIFAGDSIFLSLSRAHKVSHDIHPQLFNVVEEMKIAANLPSMPQIYIIDSPSPNAFATGIKSKKSSIAVTAGLLSRLNRNELQGVVAHEMSHIINRDVLFMTLSGIMLGSIVLISQIFLRGMWYSSGSSRRYRSSRSSGGGGQAQLIIFIVAIVFAILAPIITRLLYFAISRKREYLADATAVRLTRYPEGLASALEKISSSNIPLDTANKVTAPMYIANPFKKKKMKAASSFSTHPPISERVKILRNMSHGAGFSDYQKSFSTITGSQKSLIPSSELNKKEAISIKKTAQEEKQAPPVKKQMRDVGDLMRAVNKYAFLICVCGLKIKTPPDFKKSQISCPKCKKTLQIPTAALAAGLSMAADINKTQPKSSKQPLVYKRKSKSWESFGCTCGNILHVSPAFSASHQTCRKCNKKIKIVNAD
jgi:heat shock protein HtpX